MCFPACLDRFHAQSVDTWTVALEQLEQEAVSRDNLLSLEAEYCFDLHKPLLETFVTKYDAHLIFGPCIALLGMRLLDLQSAAESAQRWLGYETLIHKDGEFMIAEYACVFGVLRHTQRVDCAAEILSVAGLTWENADSMPAKRAPLVQCRGAGPKRPGAHRGVTAALDY